MNSSDSQILQNKSGTFLTDMTTLSAVRNATSRKSVYHKTKNPFGANIMNVTPRQDQYFCSLAQLSLNFSNVTWKPPIELN